MSQLSDKKADFEQTNNLLLAGLRSKLRKYKVFKIDITLDSCGCICSYCVEKTDIVSNNYVIVTYVFGPNESEFSVTYEHSKDFIENIFDHSKFVDDIHCIIGEFINSMQSFEINYLRIDMKNIWIY